MPDITNEVSIAVDTSGRVGSICVGRGEEILAEKYFSGAMKHAAEVFPTLVEILEMLNLSVSEIKNIFVAAGPGSFTGLRIGVTMAKMMALAANVKIASASTLDIVACNAIDYIEQNNLDITRIATILDAKRQQFFVATYEKDGSDWIKKLDDSMTSVDDFLKTYATDSKKPIFLLGEGLKYYQKRFNSDAVSFFDESLWAAQAKNVYKLCYQKALAGNFEDACLFKPKYLRLSDAQENLARKSDT